MDPRRSYQTRPDLSAQFDTTPAPRVERAERATGQLRLLGARRPTDGPLLGSPRRGRWRSRLLVAAVVLLVIALLVFAFIFARLAFPQ
jgi:hypothetical protein